MEVKPFTLSSFAIFLSLIMMCGISIATQQDGAQSKATKSEVLMASGQWKDPETGLVWMRCSVGQKWENEDCSSKASKLTLKEALDYPSSFNEKIRLDGKNDWRLPTAVELGSIRKCSNGWARRANSGQSEIGKSSIITKAIPDEKGGYVVVPEKCHKGFKEPTIDVRIFPNTPRGDFWSSTPHDVFTVFNWSVFLKTGQYTYAGEKTTNFLRLVRSE